MKVLYFCGNRYSARKALNSLLKKNIQIVGCVFEEEHPNELSDLCEKNNIPCYTSKKLYDSLEKNTLPDFDLGISYLYRRIIKPQIIEFANYNIINFHPAPIEKHRGIAACCYCLLNEFKEWAVTAHYVSPGIDEGDIIMERSFSVEGLNTCAAAEKYIQEQSLILFDEVISLFLEGKKIPGIKQNLSSGIYFSHKDLDNVKKVNLTDSADLIDKKICALWMPPYHGACIEIGGKIYSLVNEEILQELADLYQKVNYDSLEK